MNLTRLYTASFIFSLLIVFASLPVSLATEKIDYCGVKENEKFEWAINFDEEITEDLIEDYEKETSGISTNEILDIIDDYKDIERFRLVINDIDEGNSKYYDFDYSEIQFEAEYFQEGEWTEIDNEIREFYESEYSYPTSIYMAPMLLIDGDDIDENNIQYLSYGGIFMPTNMDWDNLEDYIDQILDQSSEDIKVNFESKSNGFEADIDLGSNMDDISTSVRYNDRGVLEFLQIQYAGIEVGKIQLGGIIPGYELFLITLSLCIAVLGIIFHRKYYK